MTKMLARALLAIGTLALVSVGVSAPADAAHKHRHVTAHRFGHYLAWRHFHHYHHHYYQATHLARKQPRFAAHRRASLRTTSHHIAGTLPGPCRVAASMGGPCGCWAEWVLLGRLEHVLRDAIGTWNPWLADAWRQHYPRVAPAPGTAAVWPHRHVAPVVAVHNDGTVTVRDSWATHRVRTAGLVFVQPPTLKRPPIIHWTGPL